MRYPLPPQLNTLTAQGYRKLLASPHGRKQVNTLGLFRSIVENRKLSEEEKASIRDACRGAFPKFYEFLPVKDPSTYMKLECLGRDMTEGDMDALRARLKQEQAAWLGQRRIRHRNFGTYATHSHCDCPVAGAMTKPKYRSMDPIGMRLPGDRRDVWEESRRARLRKKARRQARRLLQGDWEGDVPPPQDQLPQ